LKPVMSLIRQLGERRDLAGISIQKAGFKLELRRQARVNPRTPLRTPLKVPQS
jgi:hypothetical protein